VSVASSGNFEYLRNYLYVSVRDQFAYDRLKNFCDVELVPCTTVLMPHPPMEYIRGLPNCGFLKKAFAKKEGYVVVDRGLYALPQKQDPRLRIKVDTRPWMRDGVKPDFAHRNPHILAAVVQGASAVYCTTLHLSIIAMAMGTPFVYYEPQPGKGMAYWARAGFPECVVQDMVMLNPITLTYLYPKFDETRLMERQAARRHLSHIATLIKANQ
jgi:hypothetical protein